MFTRMLLPVILNILTTSFFILALCSSSLCAIFSTKAGDLSPSRLSVFCCSSVLLLVIFLFNSPVSVFHLLRLSLNYFASKRNRKDFLIPRLNLHMFSESARDVTTYQIKEYLNCSPLQGTIILILNMIFSIMPK